MKVHNVSTKFTVKGKRCDIKIRHKNKSINCIKSVRKDSHTSGSTIQNSLVHGLELAALTLYCICIVQKGTKLLEKKNRTLKLYTTAF